MSFNEINRQLDGAGSREQRIRELSENLLRRGLAMTKASARMLAESMVDTERRVQQQFQKKKETATQYNDPRSVPEKREVAPGFIGSSIGKLDHEFKEAKSRENADAMRERARNPMPVDVQAHYDMPKKNALEEMRVQEAAVAEPVETEIPEHLQEVSAEESQQEERNDRESQDSGESVYTEYPVLEAVPASVADDDSIAGDDERSDDGIYEATDDEEDDAVAGLRDEAESDAAVVDEADADGDVVDEAVADDEADADDEAVADESADVEENASAGDDGTYVADDEAVADESDDVEENASAGDDGTYVADDEADNACDDDAESTNDDTEDDKEMRVDASVAAPVVEREATSDAPSAQDLLDNNEALDNDEADDEADNATADSSGDDVDDKGSKVPPRENLAEKYGVDIGNIFNVNK